MDIQPGTQVSQVVLDHPETVNIFRAHHIDFCCGGRVSLQATCEKIGLDLSGLIGELEGAIRRRGDIPLTDPRSLTTRELIEHIVVRHHGFLRQSLPVVTAMSEKVARVHGAHGPKLCALDTAVAHLAALLLPHLDREERVLFPALLGCVPGEPSPLVARELAEMHRDHLEVGRTLESMRALADDYAVPDWGCITYRTLFAELEALEADIHRHVHLENNVLMPRYARLS